MNDELEKTIESAKLWRDSLITADSAYVYIAVECVETLESLREEAE